MICRAIVKGCLRARPEQMRKFFIQQWQQKLALARHGRSRVQSLLSPLALAVTEKNSGPHFPGKMADKIQRGFSLVSAIFLLVVIAALGTFAVTLSTTQHQSAALDVIGVRAYQAARAGIEWGAYAALRNGACPGGVAPALPGTLAGFTVNVACVANAPNENGVAVNMYQLTSTAFTTGAAAGTPNYVERRISVTIEGN